MSLLINIDTATELGSVCITLSGLPIAFTKNESQKEHASFVHTAIAGMLKETGINLTDIEAFAVTSGPGSYTGLRVGMAAAKGFCYALSKPLIAINTLEVMTKAAIDSRGNGEENILFCPMIDARRMEVFTAIYNAEIKSILYPQPLVLKEGIFDNYMTSNKILFFGSGSLKFKQLETNDSGIFSDIKFNATHLAKLAEKAFYESNFTDVSHSEPNYFKDFHSISKN